MLKTVPGQFLKENWASPYCAAQGLIPAGSNRPNWVRPKGRKGRGGALALRPKRLTALSCGGQGDAGAARWRGCGGVPASTTASDGGRRRKGAGAGRIHQVSFLPRVFGGGFLGLRVGSGVAAAAAPGRRWRGRVGGGGGGGDEEEGLPRVAFYRAKEAVGAVGRRQGRPRRGGG